MPRHRLTLPAACLSAAAAAALAGGCQTTTTVQSPYGTPMRGTPKVIVDNGGPADPVIPRGQSITGPNALELMDPCADRLADIGGLIALYYARAGAMPGRVEDVAPLAGIGVRSPNFTCPVSNKPYVYVGADTTPGYGVKRLVAYSPAKDARGLRPCLMMTRIPGSAKSLTSDIEHLTDEKLKPYLGSLAIGEQPPPPKPVAPAKPANAGGPAVAAPVVPPTPPPTPTVDPLAPAPTPKPVEPPPPPAPPKADPLVDPLAPPPSL